MHKLRHEILEVLLPFLAFQYAFFPLKEIKG